MRQELETAIRLALQAGEAILRYSRLGLPVERKAGDEPVTLADRVADDLIRAGLQAAFPHDGLPSELTHERFKEVYGEEAEMVSVGGMGAGAG